MLIVLHEAFHFENLFSLREYLENVHLIQPMYCWCMTYLGITNGRSGSAVLIQRSPFYIFYSWAKNKEKSSPCIILKKSLPNTSLKSFFLMWLALNIQTQTHIHAHNSQNTYPLQTKTNQQRNKGKCINSPP